MGHELARFLPLLSWLARRQAIPLGCPLESGDLVSEAYVVLLRKIGRFDPERGSLAGFVKAVGRGAMRDAVRFSMRIRGSGRSMRRRAVPVSLDWSVPAPTRDVPLEMSVDEALELLPPRRRELVQRHCMEGESARELAREADRSEDWAYCELWRARTVLRWRLRSSVA